MASHFKLKIITPAGVKYEGDVQHARVPVENGTVGILANHTEYITASAGGSLEVKEAGAATKQFHVGAGLFTVAKNQAAYVTNSFEQTESSL